MAVNGRFEVGHLAPLELKTSTVFLGDIVVVNVLREGSVNVRRGENEDFGDGDRVEPALDPAPDCGEEAWRTDNLAMH